VAGSTTYDAMRGLITELPAGGGTAEACLASGGTANQAPDASTPAIGTGFYYLVRGVNGGHRRRPCRGAPG